MVLHSTLIPLDNCYFLKDHTNTTCRARRTRSLYLLRWQKSSGTLTSSCTQKGGLHASYAKCNGPWHACSQSHSCSLRVNPSYKPYSNRCFNITFMPSKFKPSSEKVFRNPVLHTCLIFAPYVHCVKTIKALLEVMDSEQRTSVIIANAAYLCLCVIVIHSMEH
jgi:hypothetical protein